MRALLIAGLGLLGLVAVLQHRDRASSSSADFQTANVFKETVKRKPHDTNIYTGRSWRPLDLSGRVQR